MKPSKNCITPEMPYCPACEYGRVVYPEWVETYEETKGCACEWVCMFVDTTPAEEGAKE